MCWKLLTFHVLHSWNWSRSQAATQIQHFLKCHTSKEFKRSNLVVSTMFQLQVCVKPMCQTYVSTHFVCSFPFGISRVHRLFKHRCAAAWRRLPSIPWIWPRRHFKWARHLGKWPLFWSTLIQKNMVELENIHEHPGVVLGQVATENPKLWPSRECHLLNESAAPTFFFRSMTWWEMSRILSFFCFSFSHWINSRFF